MPLIDALKAIACLLIVSHHLAFYGPMSDLAAPLLFHSVEWLSEYGRMAVQIFFVVSGFLMAAKFAPHGIPVLADPIRDIKHRYVRLAVPYLTALALAIAFSTIARLWMTHDSIPGEPGLLQILSHVLLLQGLLGQESLSAGVWYVAIDFQLFALMVILLRLSAHLELGFPSLQSTAPTVVAAMTIASLFVFNRDQRLDETALYFFGSYGLGVLGYWASKGSRSKFWLTVLSLVVVAALVVDFRARIAVAGSVMLLLALGRRHGFIETLWVPRAVTGLARISYSVFLVHFPVCLVVNAAFVRFFPHEPAIQAFGMAVALSASITIGALFFKWIENRPVNTKLGLVVPAGFAASALVVGFGLR